MHKLQDGDDTISNSTTHTHRGKADAIMMEAENLARLRESQTPLLGGDNPELHPSDFSVSLLGKEKYADKEYILSNVEYQQVCKWVLKHSSENVDWEEFSQRDKSSQISIALTKGETLKLSM
ncbi:hypothetical protein IFM89_015447 [Coptis chinensis]|uniref:Uncharacterized protein n=1 Tax=Coptis chinensis TaxID=261450 RepID=A0A835M9U3_9MAGN|nr:hypothetical protein IFM89_015447 [Coptis chinensis]